MNDKEIVCLYLRRDEKAIEATKERYGRYIYSISYSVLGQKEDAEECENDTYLAAWNSIPPNEPKSLSTYLGKLSRRIAINRWKHNNRGKRGGGNMDSSIDELCECLPFGDDIEREIEQERLTEILDSFLRTLHTDERDVFMRKYFFFDSVESICEKYGFSEGKVKMMLSRTRKKLYKRLQEEDFDV